MQVASNADVAEAQVMLLSAWNEHDEGHWIAPALPKCAIDFPISEVTTTGAVVLKVLRNNDSG